ncbi:DNA-binding response regulator, partial [Escherichia coli]|nr:DNA-binding response regulator [Escherichia coli]
MNAIIIDDHPLASAAIRTLLIKNVIG